MPVRHPEELPNIYDRKEYEAGFTYDRLKGKNHCAMSKTVRHG